MRMTQGVYPGNPGQNKEKRMRRKLLKDHRKRNAGKVFMGLLVGGVVGAIVRSLISPVRSGPRIAQERFKTAKGNIESQVRDLAEDAT
jgi:hypothetical protein